MRILELVPTLGVGGAERVVSLLAGGLRDLGHEVVVVSLGPSEGSWIEGELVGSGVAVHFLDKGAGLDLRVVPRLARLLRRLRPDVIHTHLHVLKYLLPARAAWRTAPVVHTLHNLAEREAEALDRRLQQQVFGRGVHAVAIGEAVAASVVQVYGRPAAATIPNAVPVDALQVPEGTREAVRAELGLDPRSPVVLAVGRLDAQKDHALLLEALARPELQALDAHLLVAGEGSLRGALEARAARLDLAGRVRLLGVRSDVPRLLAAADVFALPSVYEGNPLVVMEALAAGRPVVATAVGCVPELVDDQTGRLVAHGDADALARALHAELSQPEAARERGEAARQRARERFDVPVMARGYAALFASLAPGRSSGTGGTGGAGGNGVR